MGYYIVVKKEIWISKVRVQADSQIEAIEKACNMEEEVIQNSFEYSHTMDPNTWIAYKEGIKK